MTNNLNQKNQMKPDAKTPDVKPQDHKNKSGMGTKSGSDKSSCGC